MIPLALLRRGLAGPVSSGSVALFVWWILPVPGGRYASAVLFALMAWAMLEVWRVDLAWQVHDGRRATIRRQAASRSGPVAWVIATLANITLPRGLFGLIGIALAATAVARAVGLA